MTTVIAYATGEHTIMAADSMTNVYERPVDGAAKVVRLATTSGDGHYLLGFSGEGAGPSITSRSCSVATLPDFARRTDRDAWASAIASAITETFLEHQLVEGQRQDSTLLLAAGGRVWTLTHHQAIPHLDGIAAVGSGEGPAIGALHALLSVGHDPVAAVVQACQTGMRYDRYSGGRVRLRMLPGAGMP